MKKMMSALCWTLLLCVLAVCASGEGQLLTDEYFGNLAMAGGKLHFSMGNGFVSVSYTPEEGIQIIAEEARDYVFSNAEEAYFVLDNQLYREDAPKAPILTLPSAYQNEDWTVQYFLVQDTLVVYCNNSIALLSLATGREAMLTGGDVYGITVDDNCIYALQVDSTQEHFYCLRAYDTQGKLQRTVTTFDQADVYGLCCDSITGALYWIQTSTLYRWQNGNAEPLRILPLDWLTTRRVAVFAQKYVAAVGTGELYLFDMTQTQDAVSLTIRGIQSEGFGVDGAFMLENPNRAIQRNNDNAMTAENVYTAIMGKEDTVDLFLVQWSSSLVELIQRGYLEALNSEGLLADVASMYPAFQEMVTYHGTLYAVPENLIVKGWRVSADMAEQVEAPETLAELLDFIEAWEENDANDGRPVVADDVYGAWTAADFASYALEQYVMTAVQQGKEIDFQDENLMALLERIRQMKEQHLLSDTSEPIRSGCVFAAARTLSKYQNSVDVLGVSMDRWRIIRSPALEAENSPAVGVTLTVYVVNPYSRHIAEAQQFLTYMAQNRHEQIGGCLNAHCEATLRESAQAELDELSAEERQGVLNKPSSWMYHEAALTAYREQILPYLCVTPCRLLENERQSSVVPWVELQNAVQQYMDGMTDIRSCVQRLNAIVRTQILEN